MGILDIFKPQSEEQLKTEHDMKDIVDSDKNKDSRQRNRPQDEVPVERVMMYIVRDYQRMYEENERIRKLSHEAAVHVGQVLEENKVLKQRCSNLQEIVKNDESGKAQAALIKTQQARISELEKRVNDLKKSNESKDLKDAKDAIITLRRIRQIIEARDYTANEQ